MIDNPDYKGTGIGRSFYPFHAVLWIRIRMFLGLLDPDPLLSCTDPDLGPSIIKQK